VPLFPGARSYPDLSLRTYVHDQYTGARGTYCFSLDASNLLAVALAHACFHLPCHWAEMHLEQRSEREFAFYSRRRFSGRQVVFKARYRGLGPNRRQLENYGSSFESFFTERPFLFSSNRAGQPIRANLHYVPWPLEEAEADIEHNDLGAAIGIHLAKQVPVLHYSRRLALYIWPMELVRPVVTARAVTAAVTPAG
jgi:uncharacterized protein YqjF (DUF2071 family)